MLQGGAGLLGMPTLLALLGLVVVTATQVSSAAGATCLPSGTPSESRGNLTVGDVSMPLGFWVHDWASARLATAMAGILVQEVLGIHTQISGVGSSSTSGLYAAAGCADPAGFADPVAAGCNLTTWEHNPHHVSMEVWGLAKITTMEQRLASVSAIIPEDAGPMGYVGVDGIYVFSELAESVYEATGKPIEYYKEWNTRWHTPWRYFDTMFSFDPAALKPCNATRLMNSAEMQNYFSQTGDEEGIWRDSTGAVTQGACWNDSWWISPSCRHNLSQCVPSITASSGWGMYDTMQKATVFNMPIAIAVATSTAGWKELGRSYRGAPYWYTPDDTFVDKHPVRIVFPPYSPEEYRSGLRISSASATPLSKWLWSRLLDVSPGIHSLLSAMEISEQAMTSMLVDAAVNSTDSHEQVACRWIQSNQATWEAWIPSNTHCQAGLGLVDAAGEYVASLADGAVACDFCPAGRFSQEVVEQNTRICTLCSPGSSQAAPLRTQCDPCVAGYEARAAGQSACTPCSEGFFQNATGSSFCHACAELAVTRLLGATSPDMCVCPDGMYEVMGSRALGALKCQLCPYGIDCVKDSREALLFNRSENQEGNMPLIWEGFMTRPADPWVVYKCLHKDTCPGGAPGSCGLRRDIDAVACGECEAGAHEDGSDLCRSCSDWQSTLILMFAPVVTLLALLVLDWAANREKITEAIANASCAIIAGLTCASLQTMSVFSTLEVNWVEPLKSLLSTFSVLGFDIKIVSAGCIVSGSQGPPGLTLLRQLLAPVLAAGLVIIAGVRMLLKKRHSNGNAARGSSMKDFKLRVTNSVGSLLMLFFISIVLSGLMPLICYKHPDSNGASVVNSPSVLCFKDDDRHSQMVVYGLLGLLLVALPFFAGVLWGTWRYPTLLSGSKLDNSYQLRRFYFLFRRFESHAYFYGSIVLTRGLLICLIPVVFRDNSAAHVILLTSLLLIFAFIQGALRPWRGALANYIDTCVSSLLVVLMSCAALSTDVPDAEDTIGIFGLLAMIAFLLLLLTGLAYAVSQRLHPSPYYSRFICHHKAHAAAQARLLQLMLQMRTQQTCFIDSDDLTNLDELFDIVRTRVKTLVVYLTSDTLKRPWCAGEVTTAYKAGVSILRVHTPSFMFPEASVLEAPFESYLDPIGPEVIQAGIIEQDVALALQWVLSDAVKVFRTNEASFGTHRFVKVVEELIQRGDAVSTVGDLARRRPDGALLISSEEGCDEATASAGIICIMLQEWAMAQYSHGVMALSDLPEMHHEPHPDFHALQTHLSKARGLLALLTAGTMSSSSQVTTLLVALGISSTHPSHLSPVRQNSGGDRGHLQVPATATSPGRTTSAQRWVSSAVGEDVIPVSTAAFNFPGEHFYNHALPQVIAHTAFSPEHAAELLTLFFRRICVRFSPSASRTILESEVNEIRSRVLLIEQRIKDGRSTGAVRGSSAVHSLIARVHEAAQYHSDSSGKSEGASAPSSARSTHTGRSYFEA